MVSGTVLFVSAAALAHAGLFVFIAIGVRRYAVMALAAILCLALVLAIGLTVSRSLVLEPIQYDTSVAIPSVAVHAPQAPAVWHFVRPAEKSCWGVYLCLLGIIGVMLIVHAPVAFAEALPSAPARPSSQISDESGRERENFRNHGMAPRVSTMLAHVATGLVMLWVSMTGLRALVGTGEQDWPPNGFLILAVVWAAAIQAWYHRSNERRTNQSSDAVDDAATARRLV